MYVSCVIFLYHLLCLGSPSIYNGAVTFLNAHYVRSTSWCTCSGYRHVSVRWRVIILLSVMLHHHSTTIPSRTKHYLIGLLLGPIQFGVILGRRRVPFGLERAGVCPTSLVPSLPSCSAEECAAASSSVSTSFRFRFFSSFFGIFALGVLACG